MCGKLLIKFSYVFLMSHSVQNYLSVLLFFFKPKIDNVLISSLLVVH